MDPDRPKAAAGDVSIMNTQSSAEPLRPVEALNALIAHHGLGRVMLALPAALVQRRRDRLTLNHALSPHLMRDIGMPPDRSRYWEMR
jgi:hypothetical protein